MVGDQLSNKQTIKAPVVKAFTCTACGAGVVIRASGHTITAVCGSCSSIIDISNENYKVIDKASKTGKREQVISLGQRGKLHGSLWEVIGYLERTDGTDTYRWSEYLLFNPLKGFRWLTEFDGHWNYVITTKSNPEMETGESIGNYGRALARYMGKTYYLFHQGSAKVSYAIGEFYWQVKQGDKVLVKDFISPPEILSLEKNENEVIWSLGQYVEANEVKTAFQVSKNMPLQIGVAPNQFSSTTHALSDIIKYWGIFLGIVILLQLLFISISKNQTVYTGQFDYSPADLDKIKVSPQFELPQGLKNVEIFLKAPVQNSWVEIQGDLVNDDNGDTIEFEQGVEFYSGYDSDGYWTEGSQQSGKVISSVPSGKYHLNIEAMNGQQYATSYSIEVKRDVRTWSNFLWTLILLSIYPIFIWWRSRSFEMNRWSQSDFSPYYEQQEDDE